MPLQPVTRKSLPDAVFDQLGAEIIGGELPPGRPLPAERTLTEMLGVNRQAVREALKRLEQAGLVAICQGGPTVVRDYRRTAGLDLLPRLLIGSDGAVDPGVARSVMEMRAVVGADAARLCAQRALPELAGELHAVADALAGTAPVDPERLALDWRFWELVVDGSDNIAYRLAFNSLRAGAEPLGSLLLALVGDEHDDLEAHRALVTAVSAGDGDAAHDAARRLLRHGLTRVNELLAGAEGDLSDGHGGAT